MSKISDYVFLPDASRSLADYDARHSAGLSKQEGLERLQPLSRALDDIQDYLYAAHHHGVLVVLQGMDTSGKDGTIRDVFGSIDPLGLQVWAFKAPTEVERDRDFLWRVHHQVPGRGTITVFNRSHYEDVLVARVKRLVPEAVWKKRFDHINHFEALLTDHDTLVIKFFLHISKEEQKERLTARAEHPDKAWKLAPSDWEDRKLWDEYQQAYWEAICRCHTHHAPWYIVPADRKWYRNLAVANTMVELLKPFTGQWKAELEQRGREGLETLKRLQSVPGA